MTVSKREDLGSPASSAASAGTGSKAVSQHKWCVVDERGDGGYIYVELGPDHDPLCIHDESNAHLIAAAPDLLEALREMVMAAGGVGLDASGRRKRALANALVVLAKATHPLDEGQNRAQSADTQI